MRTIFQLLAAISLCVFLTIGCSNDAMRDFPRVTTFPASVRSNEGAVLSAEISNHKEFSISECGFLIYKGAPSEANFIGALTGALNKTNGVFSAEIGTGIKKGEVYYFVAYASSGTMITLGNELSYLSDGGSAAQILDFSPDKGAPKDTVLIQLSEKIGGVSDFVVKFNQLSAKIVDFQDNILRVVVPAGIDLENTISITTGSVTNNSDKKFRLNAMKIIDVNPKSGQTLDTITIQIVDLFEKGGAYIVRFNDLTATITSAQSDIIKVIVPLALSVKESTISIQVGDYTDYFSQKFQLIPCIINSFSPTELFPFQTVTIHGENFHRVANKNIVRFDNVTLVPISSSTTQLMVNVPVVLVGRECTVSVTIDNQTTISPTKIKILGERPLWERLSDFPGGNLHKLGAFSIGEFGYAGLGFSIQTGLSNLFWRYQPSTDTWIRKSDFPGQMRCEPKGFTLNGSGYFGAGYSSDSPSMYALKDFYKYNTDTDTWNLIATYAGNYESKFVGTSGAVGNKAYISFTYDDFYSLNEGSNIWTKLANPGNGMFHAGSSFTIDNIIYFVGGTDRTNTVKNEVWAYNTSTGTWTRKNDFPGQARRTAIGFASGDLGFFGLGSNYNFSTMYNDMWMYNSAADAWTRIVDFPGSARTCPFVFVIDDVAYIGTGYKASGLLTNEVYRLTISNLR